MDENLNYGKTNVDIVVFDIWRENREWCDVEDFLHTCEEYDMPTVPIIQTNYPFNFDEILKISNGPSLIKGANHHREGCVIKPMKERHDYKIGRVILKCVGEDYLLGKNKKRS